MKIAKIAVGCCAFAALVAQGTQMDAKARVFKTVDSALSGPVEITCDNPGKWTFDVKAGTDAGRDVITVRISSPEDAVPPKFGVFFRVPGAGVRNVWTPDFERDCFKVDPQLWWGWTSKYTSQLARDMPIAVAFNDTEASPVAIACSEAFNYLQFGLYADDRTCEMVARCEFFQQPVAACRSYQAKILLDRRGRKWYEVVRACTDWIVAENGFRPADIPEAAYDPLYSTWYAYLQDVHDKALEKEARHAAAVGMKTMILDDGWQKEDSKDFYSACGDWMPAKSRFPDMKAHVAEVHKAGLKYMLWLGVPFMGKEAKNYPKFKEKMLSGSNLDPRFPEVREYLISTYERVVRDWGFDGVKLDFIDQFQLPNPDPALKDNYAGRDYKSLPDAVDRLMKDVLARLRAINPDVLVEFRQHYMGPAMRQYGNMIRAADCPDDVCSNRRRICDLRLTSGRTAVHSDMLVWSRDETPAGAALPILSALFGTVQYSMILDTVRPEHKAVIRHWIDFTTAHRETLLKGELRPHHPESGYSWIEAESAAERIVAVYSPSVCANLGAGGKPVLVVNATGAASLTLRLAAAPSKVEAFDTFGKPAAAPSVGKGLQDVAIPPSGYLKLTFPPMTAFANEHVSLVFDEAGRIASIRETATGRELVAEPAPMVAVTTKGGREQLPKSFRAKGDRLFYVFAKGAVELDLKPFPGGWTFTVAACTVPDAAALQFARVMPVCTKRSGLFVNGMSDDASAVVLRAYELETEMYLNGSMGLHSYAGNSGIVLKTDDLGLRLVCEMPQTGFVGLRGGLAAGPRGEILGMLRAMTREAGVPQTDFGGAWSLGSAGTRRSYLFADLAARAADDWIELAERSGFGTIHFHAWWQWLGHYLPRKEFFPGGLAEMKSVVGKIHAAGLTAGIHTLSGSIDPEFDPWVRPVPSPDLLAVASYTLARPLSTDARELFVSEIPTDRHDFVHTYFSSGNTLRIGTELINYTGLSREKPYRFTGLERGAFGTRAQGHAAGARCDYLRQRYLAFYPDPATPLVHQLAACISNVYTTCGFDQLYLDGSEGSGTRYATDRTRHILFSAMKPNRDPVLLESSCQGPHNWWFHGRYGARDIPYLGAKRFHDHHIRDVRENGILANFLAPQLGWWQPRQATDGLRGHFPDEMEYFAGKNAGWDSASAILGADVTKGPLPFGVLKQMTLLGWYERARVARAFRPEVLTALRRERAEFRLRQDEDGTWRIRPADALVHRVTDRFSRAWRVERPSAGPCGIRVEAFYTPDDAAWGNGETLVKGSDLGVFTATATTNRTFAFEGPHYRDLKGKLGFGLKVKGDGSGALLNIQFCGTPEYGMSLSEHYVKLDFTGWRYFSFLERERDSALADDHVWPYDTADRVCGTLLDAAHLGAVKFWLNDIPAGGKATVEISDLRLLAERKDPLAGGVLTLNGRRYALPFELAAGEYAELEDGAWIRYAADGSPLARKAAETPTLRTGANELAFAGGRAEVTLFALGEKSPAFADLTPEMRRGLKYEACAPVRFAPAKGFVFVPPIAVRPGETASLVVRVRGTLANPQATLVSAKGERQTVKLPCETKPLAGTWWLAPADRSADAILDIVKKY